MAVGKLYTLHAVQRSGVGAVTLSQVTEHGHNPGLDVYFGGSAGHVGDSFAAIRKAEPVLRFSTPQLNDAMGLLAATGVPVATFDSATPFEFWYAEMEEGGYIKTTAPAHIKIAVTNGIIIPINLGGAHAADAIPAFEVHATSADGVTNPITVTVNEATLPTAAVQTDLFTPGPLKINGVTLGDIQNLNFNFNLEILKKGGGGEIWPTFGCIQRPWRPTVSATVYDLRDLAQAGNIGLSGLVGTAVLYFRRKAADGGGNVADATTTHVSLTIFDGAYALPDMSNQFGQEAELPIEITTLYDGTNDVMEWDLATAIT